MQSPLRSSSSGSAGGSGCLKLRNSSCRPLAPAASNLGENQLPYGGSSSSPSLGLVGALSRLPASRTIHSTFLVGTFSTSLKHAWIRLNSSLQSSKRPTTRLCSAASCSAAYSACFLRANAASSARLLMSASICSNLYSLSCWVDFAFWSCFLSVFSCASLARSSSSAACCLSSSQAAAASWRLCSMIASTSCLSFSSAAAAAAALSDICAWVSVRSAVSSSSNLLQRVSSSSAKVLRVLPSVCSTSCSSSLRVLRTLSAMIGRSASTSCRIDAAVASRSPFAASATALARGSSILTSSRWSTLACTFFTSSRIFSSNSANCVLKLLSTCCFVASICASTWALASLTSSIVAVIFFLPMIYACGGPWAP
mmetsp:Transcript_51499/g.130112  ORF Transcript_51499/g.130112 Transcript_51499/m.130112 type:complete len:369 (-) Transcript_51499:69-1175(-)